MLQHAVVAAIVVGLSAPVAADDKLLQATCEGGLCCTEWAMDVRDANGKAWGLTIGSTPDEVRERFTKAAELEASYCRFFGKERPCSRNEHASAGPLRCSGGGAHVNPDPADVCGNDLKQRIERLEKRFEAQTTRLKTTQKVIETIRMSASAITPASGFGQPLQALGSFGVALNDAAARARRLGEAVSLACLKPTLEAVDDTGPLLWAGGSYGVASVTMSTLYGPTWADGGFGGPDERKDDTATLKKTLTDLERVAATELPALPLVTIAIPDGASASIRSKSRKGTGRIVIADLGLIEEEELDLGQEEATAVFVFADKDSSPRIGTVKVTRSKTPNGTEITLVGQGGGSTETVVILVARTPKPHDEPTTAQQVRSPPAYACGADPWVVVNREKTQEELAARMAWRLCDTRFQRAYAMWVLDTNQFVGISSECVRTYIAALDKGISLYEAGQKDQGDDYVLSRRHWPCVGPGGNGLWPSR